MKNAMKLMVVGLALGTMTGCEALREQAQVRGVDALSADSRGTEQQSPEDCDGCRRKWSAKPGGGVNGPPWGM